MLSNKYILNLEHYHSVELELSVGLIAVFKMDSVDKGIQASHVVTARYSMGYFQTHQDVIIYPRGGCAKLKNLPSTQKVLIANFIFNRPAEIGIATVS